MILQYNDFAITDLGDVTISQSREYEGGDSPQRVRVMFRVKVDIFQKTFSDNYNLVQQLRDAVATQHAPLVWMNEDTNETYVDQPAVLVSNDLPEDPNGWGTYYQQCNLVFMFYENNLVTSNLPLVIKPTTGTVTTITLNNVRDWEETDTVERWSPLHSQRKMIIRKVTVSGVILSDPTQTIDQQREFLAGQKSLLDGLDGRECLMTFGDFFSQTVRVDEFTAKVDQGANQLAYSFTSHYTIFPDEAGYAMAEYQAAQRDNNTGELFLDVTGKIMASDEPTARARLATLTTTVLASYQFNAGQPLKTESSASQVSPAGTDDPDFFTELSFSFSYRKWRTDNQDATFKAVGASTPVNLPNIKVWAVDYNAKRFSELRSQRQYAGGRVECSGTIPGDMTITIANRRTALLALINGLIAAVNKADGTLARGTLFNQVVRVENFKAEINQAITGIDWSLSAIWTNFPNETGYATTEYSVATRDSVEDGEQYLVFSGRIWAQSAIAATAQLNSVRSTVLTTYQFAAAQQIREESNTNKVYANGDKTAGLSTVEGSDGTTFIELTWTEEYRQRLAGLLNWNLKTAQKDDLPSGLRMTTYNGVVQATGSTPDAAYAAALAQAQTLGANKEAAIGNNAFLKSSTITQDTRQTRADNGIEFVRLEFSYEYQSKLATGNMYVEVSMELAQDAFGMDLQNVSGFIMATDFGSAEDVFASIRSLYGSQLVRNERTNETQVQALTPNMGSFDIQPMRLDFAFSVFQPKGTRVAIKYGISVMQDIINLQLNTRLHGSIWASSMAAAQSAMTTLMGISGNGSLIRQETTEDHENTNDSSDYFVKMDFDLEYTAALKGVADLIEMNLVEEVNYSGPRWVVIPTLAQTGVAGSGYSVVQNLSFKEGGRVVRGSVTALNLTSAQAWAKKQRGLLVGTYVQPEQWSTTRDFVPRIEAVAFLPQGAPGTVNVRIYRVEFTFSEILPNYPAPT